MRKIAIPKGKQRYNPPYRIKWADTICEGPEYHRYQDALQKAVRIIANSNNGMCVILDRRGTVIRKVTKGSLKVDHLAVPLPIVI
jgi:hypothetical protein